MEQELWHVAGDIFYGALLFIVGYLWNSLKGRKRDWDAMRKGILAILRNNLILIHNEAVSKGSISFTQAENAKDMFQAYTELGGNGIIPDMMKEIQRLPKETIERRA